MFSSAHGENVAVHSGMGIGPGKAAQKQAGDDGDGHSGPAAAWAKEAHAVFLSMRCLFPETAGCPVAKTTCKLQPSAVDFAPLAASSISPASSVSNLRKSSKVISGEKKIAPIYTSFRARYG